MALALALERAVRAGDPRIRGVRVAIYGDRAGEAALATSTGLAAFDAATTCSLSVSALAGEGAGTQTGYAADAQRSPDGLDVEDVARRAVERATRMLGARQPATRRVAVVLEPSVVASLLGVLGGVLTGDAVLKGRSPFGERVGEEVAAGLTLVDDPTDEASLGAGAYDGEGLACRRTSLLEDGVLVQEVSGLHSGINPVSGDVSVGAEGLVIRDGALAEPFREATIASTLQRLLLDVLAVGADFEWRPGGTGAPSLAVADIALGGS